MRTRLLLLALCAGCSPTPPSGVFKCASDSDCPAEQTCARDAPGSAARHCYLEPPDLGLPDVDSSTQCSSEADGLGCDDAGSEGDGELDGSRDAAMAPEDDAEVSECTTLVGMSLSPCTPTGGGSGYRPCVNDKPTGTCKSSLDLLGDGGLLSLPDSGLAFDGGSNLPDAGGQDMGECTETLSLPLLSNQPIPAYRCTLDDGGTGLIPCPSTGLPNLGCIDPTS